MGLDKFFDDKYDKMLDDDEVLTIPNNDYKTRVDNEINNVYHDYNLMNMERMEIKKKVPMSVYFAEEDLNLLKAIAYTKNTTVNKVLMNILYEPLKITQKNLPEDFNIKRLCNLYEKTCRKRKK